MGSSDAAKRRATPQSEANGFASQERGPRMGSSDATSESAEFAG
jgi:hypothetical protein